MNRYQDKVCIITGAAKGIGRAIAERFAHEGGKVAVLDVDAEPGKETVAAIREEGGIADFYACDVTNVGDIDSVFTRVEKEWGPLDVLVNNAGIAHIGTVETTSEEDFERISQVNIKGVFLCLRAVVTRMKGRGGAILNMASMASIVAIPERFAYSMSKGAVMTMTLSVATDYLSENIRCNAIAPGRIHTPFVDGYLKKYYSDDIEGMFDKLSKTQPIGRMGRPDEVAALAAYLCSDEAAFISGNIYPIDGGILNLNVV